MVNLLCKCIVFPNLLILSTMVVSSEMPQYLGIYLLWSIYYVNASCFLTFLFYRLWLYQAIEMPPNLDIYLLWSIYYVNASCFQPSYSIDYGCIKRDAPKSRYLLTMVNLLCKCIVFPNLLILSTMVVSSDRDAPKSRYLLTMVNLLCKCIVFPNLLILSTMVVSSDRDAPKSRYLLTMVNLLCK